MFIIIAVIIKSIDTPDASVGVCCSHKVIALGFNTLCYDAERRGIKPSARIKKAPILFVFIFSHKKSTSSRLSVIYLQQPEPELLEIKVCMLPSFFSTSKSVL